MVNSYRDNLGLKQSTHNRVTRRCAYIRCNEYRAITRTYPNISDRVLHTPPPSLLIKARCTYVKFACANGRNVVDSCFASEIPVSVDLPNGSPLQVGAFYAAARRANTRRVIVACHTIHYNVVARNAIAVSVRAETLRRVAAPDRYDDGPTWRRDERRERKRSLW